MRNTPAILCCVLTFLYCASASQGFRSSDAVMDTRDPQKRDALEENPYEDSPGLSGAQSGQSFDRQDNADSSATTSQSGHSQRQEVNKDVDVWVNNESPWDTSLFQWMQDPSLTHLPMSDSDFHSKDDSRVGKHLFFTASQEHSHRPPSDEQPASVTPARTTDGSQHSNGLQKDRNQNGKRRVRQRRKTHSFNHQNRAQRQSNRKHMSDGDTTGQSGDKAQDISPHGDKPDNENTVRGTDRHESRQSRRRRRQQHKRRARRLGLKIRQRSRSQSPSVPQSINSLPHSGDQIVFKLSSDTPGSPQSFGPPARRARPASGEFLGLSRLSNSSSHGRLKKRKRNPHSNSRRRSRRQRNRSPRTTPSPSYTLTTATSTTLQHVDDHEGHQNPGDLRQSQVSAAFRERLLQPNDEVLSPRVTLSMFSRQDPRSSERDGEESCSCRRESDSCQPVELELQTLKQTYQRNLQTLKLLIVQALDEIITDPSHVLSDALCDVIDVPSSSTTSRPRHRGQKTHKDDSDDVTAGASQRQGSGLRQEWSGHSDRRADAREHGGHGHAEAREHGGDGQGDTRELDGDGLANAREHVRDLHGNTRELGRDGHANTREHGGNGHANAHEHSRDGHANAHAHGGRDGHTDTHKNGRDGHTGSHEHDGRGHADTREHDGDGHAGKSKQRGDSISDLKDLFEGGGLNLSGGTDSPESSVIHRVEANHLGTATPRPGDGEVDNVHAGQTDDRTWNRGRASSGSDSEGQTGHPNLGPLLPGQVQPERSSVDNGYGEERGLDFGDGEEEQALKQAWESWREQQETEGEGEDEEETFDPKAYDCTLGDWTEWSGPVGFGVIERRRFVVSEGKDCQLPEVQDALVMRVDVSVLTKNRTYYKAPEKVAQDFEADFTRSHAPRDLLLVLDASGSIEEEDFELMRAGVDVMVRLFCGGFGSASTNNRLAIILFSSELYVIHRFNDDQSPDTLRDVIANLTQPNGNTCTGDALLFAQEVVFTAEYGSRSDVIHDTLLVTDGHSNCGEVTIQEGAQLLRNVSNVFALGVGVANDSAARAELNSVVSNNDPRHIFSLARFQDFKGMLDSVEDRRKTLPCLPIVDAISASKREDEAERRSQRP